MLRRAASGHIEATQLSKFAAASRIALAVIRGWPEAPSSPLQGKAAPDVAGAACGCAGAADFCPEKMLPNGFGNPLPEDCACASPANSSVAASTAARVLRVIDGLVGRMSCPIPSKHPV